MSLIQAPLVTALNASTFVAITLPANAQNENDVLIWTEDGSAFSYDIIVAGTNAVTVPANSSISMARVSADGLPIMYVKASAGTPNLIVQAGPSR
jgi:hypothetical protein